MNLTGQFDSGFSRKSFSGTSSVLKTFILQRGGPMPLFKKWKTADACELLPTLDAEQTARYRRFRRLLDRDWANYFVFRINGLEDNAVLFEFRNGKRFERQSVEIPIHRDQWHRLRIETQGQQIRAFLNDQQLLEYQAERSLTGYLGLWTKADSVTLFKDLTMHPQDGQTRLVS